MAESAFIVGVPEAEPLVGALREEYDPSARLGVPAHITVLYPFMAPETITEAVLRGIRHALSSEKAFDFVLTGIERFPEALYLTPVPAAPFAALTQRLAGHFPSYPPYGGRHTEIVPHLTVAEAGEAGHDAVAARLAATLPAAGISATCKEVALMENSSGLWKPMHLFPLSA